MAEEDTGIFGGFFSEPAENIQPETVGALDYFTDIPVGIAKGLSQAVQGLISLGALPIDLVANTNLITAIDNLFDNITPEGVLVSLPNHMCPSEMDGKGPLQVNIDLTDDYLADQFSDLVKSSSVIGGDEIAIIQKDLVAMGLDNDFNGDNAQALARVVKTALELNLFQLVEIVQGGHVFRLCFHCLTTFGLSQVDRYGVCV